MHTNSYDEAICLPSEEAVMVALRTQQLIQDETKVGHTIDPLAGSYYIEWLTDRMEQKIVETMQKVEDMGGMVKAVREGHIQREVSRQAYLKEKKIQSGEIPKDGVNRYVMAEERTEIEMHPFNPVVAEEQKKKLERIKTERDNAEVESAVNGLKKAAQTGENVMPHMLEAVKAYATLGEITKVLKDVFGEFKEPVGL